MLHFISHIKANFITIVLFTVGAVLIGQGLPNLYFRYIDKTVYYKIENPVYVEQFDYKPCDDVIFEIKRNSLIDASAVYITELVLVYNNTEVKYYNDTVAISVGSDTIHAKLPLPCNLEKGDYYLRGVVTYKVRGFDKTTPFYSTQFKVN